MTIDLNNMAENIEACQEIFIAMMIADGDVFNRVLHITDAGLFDAKYRAVIRQIIEYADAHHVLPKVAILKPYLNDIELDTTWQNASRLDDDQREWFYENYERFIKRRLAQKTLLQCNEYLEKDNYGAIEIAMKKMVELKLANEIGIDFWDNPEKQLRILRDKRNIVATGWVELDRQLYGGFNRGELNIFCGISGAGKSLALGNLSLNWVLRGLNVLYISLELSEGLCTQRFSSMLLGLSSADIHSQIDTVNNKSNVIRTDSQAGACQIIRLPSGIDAHKIVSLLKEYEIQYSIKVDALVIDYMDLMHSVDKSIKAENAFARDKAISEELRNIAIEKNVLLITASQLNRSGVNEDFYNFSHIAGGLSKINTTDNLIAIRNTKTLRAQNHIEFQLIKTRNSAGNGSAIKLYYDSVSLRITNNQDEVALPSKTLRSHSPPPSPSQQMIDAPIEKLSDSDIDEMWGVY